MSKVITSLSDYRQIIALLNAGVADGERETVNIYTSDSSGDKDQYYVSLEYQFRIPKGVVNNIDFDSPGNLSNIKQLFNGKGGGTQKFRDSLRKQEEEKEGLLTEQSKKDIKDFFDKHVSTTWGKTTVGTTSGTITTVDTDKVASTPGFGPINVESPVEDNYGDGCCPETCESCNISASPEEFIVDAEATIEVGSIVQVKSGGPLMTVGTVIDKTSVFVVYFCTYSGKYVDHRISKAILQVIKQ